LQLVKSIRKKKKKGPNFFAASEQGRVGVPGGLGGGDP